MSIGTNIDRSVSAGGLDLQERVVEINRVAKVVKGGRRFSFTALVVVGDEVDRVGVGYGKAREVPLAITKAVEDAKKNLFTIPKHGSTITHEVLGTAERPRLVVFRSNRGITAQLVDDAERKTIAAAGHGELKKTFKGSKTEQAAEVGKALAAAAKKAGVEACVFDRAGYLYHGRVRALAEGAREGGLTF